MILRKLITIVKKVKIKIVNRFYQAFVFNCIGKHSRIFGKIIVTNGKDISIGDFTTINEGVFLNGKGSIRIGSHCRISPYAQLHSAGLIVSESYKNRPHYQKPIIIEDGVWICANVVVNPGITIKEGAVIGPSAVVTKNVPAYEFWAGVPAKKVKVLKNNSVI